MEPTDTPSAGQGPTHAGGPDWQTIRAFFEQAIERDPADREAFVQALPLGQEARQELRSLLDYHQDADTTGLLPPPPAGWPPSRDHGPAAGERFGAWEILRRVAAGGMGEVHEARRADGSYEARAAVKVLRPGLDGQAVLQRFAMERQALARLSHPNIARLLDAGIGPGGRPYFVMEFVDGVPIDRAGQGLPLAQRLQLFLQLTDAVAYAHRNLLVHRDLKPGNVLVTPEGQVKLLDFGIAKALDPAGAAGPGTPPATDLTQGMAAPFTPSHASPEQVRGEPVTTSSDIYSLGFLLYVMITGVRATGRTATTPAQAARAVLEEEPTRPSALSPALVADPQWARTRKHLQGDLDNILLRALEKPAERRYASVDAFAEDIRRFLAGQPVAARGAGRLYVASKFVKRHRTAVAASAAALVALCLGLGATAWQAEQARQARNESQLRLADIRAITRDLIARFGDALTALPGGMKVKEDMLNTALKTLDRLARSPDRDPELLAEVSMTYARLAELQGIDQQLSLGKPVDALVNADKAIDLALPLLAARRSDWQLAHWTARAYDIRAKVLRGQGKAQEGLRQIDQAAAVLAAVDLTGLDDLGRASIPAEQGALLMMRGQLTDQLARRQQAGFDDALVAFSQAEPVFEALRSQKALLDRLDGDARPEEGKAYAQVLSNLATLHGGKAAVHQQLEEWERAREEGEQAVSLARASVDYNPQATTWKDTLAVENNNLAVTWLQLGRPEQALQAAQACRDTALQLIRLDGATSRWNQALPPLNLQYGRALEGVGRLKEAVAAYDDGLAHFTRMLASTTDPGRNAEVRRAAAVLTIQRARALGALGQPARAVADAREAARWLEQLADAPDAPRRAALDAAQALGVMSRLIPAEAAQWRQRARERYDAARARKPLSGWAAREREALG